MNPYRCLLCLLVFGGLVLGIGGCKPHFFLATHEDRALVAQMQERESKQLEQLDSLSDRLESMQHALVTQQSDMLVTLQKRVDDQHAQLLDMAQELRRLKELKQNKSDSSVEVVRFNKVQSQAVAPDAERDKRQVVGAVERVFISPPGMIMTARVDTGATTSSIDARNVKPFEREGEPWVRFETVDPEDNNAVEIESKVARQVNIIQASTQKKERRYVVELLVTLGNTTRTAEFTLADREHLEFPALIGRNILRDSMTVDVSKSFLSVPIPPQ